jgi:hypothetical protein
MGIARWCSNSAAGCKTKSRLTQIRFLRVFTGCLPQGQPRQENSTTIMKLSISTFLLAVTVTTACGAPMSEPDIQQNPNPQKRYELTLKINNAPGPFDSVDGYMQYEIANNGVCVPEEPFSGVRKVHGTDVPFTFNRVTDDTYTGTIYLDQLKDEDYFGLGVCHWEVTFTHARMKIKKTVFDANIYIKDIIAQTPYTEYLWRAAYSEVAVKNTLQLSVPINDKIRQYPEQFFSATLTAREKLK